jgi:hypothetical protein
MAFACEKGSKKMPKGITGLGVETARVTKGKRLYLEGITLDSKRRDKKVDTIRGKEVIPSRHNIGQSKDSGKNKKREEVIPSRHNLGQIKDRG